MLKKTVAILLISMLCMTACSGETADTTGEAENYTVSITDSSPSEDTFAGEDPTQSDLTQAEETSSDTVISGSTSSGTVEEDDTDGVTGNITGDITRPVDTETAEKEPEVPAPNAVTFSRSAGVYDSEFSLMLSAPEGYTVYYTTDGTDPKTNGKMYTAPIKVNDTSAVDAGPLTRLNASLNRVQAPVAKLPGGFVVKAYAKKDGDVSGVYTSTYFVIKNAESLYGVPFVSVSLPSENFVSADKGIYYTVMADPFSKKERRESTVEIFESNGKRVCVSYAEIAMNGNGSLGMSSKSMRLYFKKSPYGDEGDGKLKYDIFAGEARDGVKEYKRLLLRNSGNDSSRAHLRDAYIQRLCSVLNAPTMAYRPSLLFVNGEFWGVYNIRERFDSKYFEEHYGIPEEDFVMIEAPSPLTTDWATNEPYVLNDGLPGDEKPFHELAEYIKTHDMSNEANYKYVCDRLDVDNFIDFFVGSIYFGNHDWPSNNIKVYRSKNITGTSGAHTKWRFVFSDMDMGCGLEGNYDRDMFSYGINESTVAGTMFSRLLGNDGFKAKFTERMAYCANEVFKADKAIQELEKMTDALDNIIDLQFKRWSADNGSMANWNTNIGVIKAYVQNRAKYVRDQLSQYYGVTNTQAMFSADLSKVQLTVGGKSITRSGYVTVTGKDQTVSVKVSPKAGYTFKGISVTDTKGRSVVYNTNSVNIKLTEAVNVVVMVSKNALSVVPKVEAGSRSVFALDVNGDLYAWGKNNLSQNGIYTSSDMLKPVLVASGIVDVAISRGGTEGDAPHTLVLTDTGRVMSIGNNSFGQLGRGGDTFVLTDIGFSKKVKAIAAGLDHTLILTESGELYGCGNNAYGQLGAANLGSTVTSLTRIASSVSSIAAGRRHTLYITTSGKLYALGDNRWNKISSSAPEVITSPFLLASDARDVYAGQHNSLYINTKGELYYFGWRSVDSFIQGSSNGKMNKLADGVKSASVMDEHIIFIKTNGDVYGFGHNDHMQISADRQNKNLPYKIMSGCVWATAGTHYSAAIRSDGNVVVWGSNVAGVFGNGTLNGEQSTPVKAMNIEVK